MATTCDKMSPSQCSHGDNRQFTMCFLDHRSAKMQNGHFRLLFHTPDNSSYDEMVMNKYIAFVGTRASLIPNVSRRTQSGHSCSGHAFLFFSFTLAFTKCFHIFLLLSWWLLFFTFCSCNCCVFYASSSSRELE